MIVNTSRGALINTADLIHGLKTGHIGAVGMDVYERESHYFFRDSSNKVRSVLLCKLFGLRAQCFVEFRSFKMTSSLDWSLSTMFSFQVIRLS